MHRLQNPAGFAAPGEVPAFLDLHSTPDEKILERKIAEPCHMLVVPPLMRSGQKKHFREVQYVKRVRSSDYQKATWLEMLLEVTD